MEIIIQPTAEAATSVAARVIARLLQEKPNAVIGLATGSTPLLLYRALIEMKLDWSGVTTFNLDEYIGLPQAHPQSYHSFMWENLFRHLNIAPENVHIPDGNAKDIPGFCAAYEQRIRDAGGIDLQVLGIGTDGHIGFNEPTSSLASRTRIKTLTPQTRQDNARFFASLDEVPTHCITDGHRHHHGSAAKPDARLRRQQGARHRRSRRRPDHLDQPGVDPADAPRRQVLSRRASRRRTEAGRVLPVGV